jgi:hypothetical protein
VPVLSLGVLYLFAVLPVAVVWRRALPDDRVALGALLEALAPLLEHLERFADRWTIYCSEELV